MKLIRMIIILLLPIGILFSKDVDLSILTDKTVLKNAKWNDKFVSEIIANYYEYNLTADDRKAYGAVPPDKLINNVKYLNGFEFGQARIYKENNIYKIILKVNLEKTEIGDTSGIPKKNNKKLLDNLASELIKQYGKNYVLQKISPSISINDKNLVYKQMLHQETYQWVIGSTTVNYIRMFDNDISVLVFTNEKLQPIIKPFIELFCDYDNKSKEIIIKIDELKNIYYIDDFLTGKIDTFNKTRISFMREIDDKEYGLINVIYNISRISGNIEIKIQPIKDKTLNSSYTGECSKYLERKF